MAMIKCPECGKEISNKAKTCPNCGRDMKWLSKRIVFIIKLIVAIIIGIMALFFGINLYFMMH